MKLVFLNPEKFSDKDLIEKFGREKFEQFTQLCANKYAHVLGSERAWKLTQDGAILWATLEKDALQFYFNVLLAGATAILAIVALIQSIAG